MGTRYSADRKRKWFELRLEMSRKAGISLDLEKLIAEFAKDNCSTRRTGMEYLKEFQLLGEIRILQNGEIMLKGVLYDEIYNETTRKWEKMSDLERSHLYEA